MSIASREAPGGRGPVPSVRGAEATGASERTSSLVGRRFPDGEYTITVAANERLCRLVKAPALAQGIAHPVWAHLATHIGKGLTFAEFAAVVGAPIDAGFLFGGGALEYVEPIRLETRYLVCGGIASVVSRVGRRTGPFDVITTELDLLDADRQQRVSRSIESYIVPRRAA